MRGRIVWSGTAGVRPSPPRRTDLQSARVPNGGRIMTLAGHAAIARRFRARRLCGDRRLPLMRLFSCSSKLSVEVQQAPTLERFPLGRDYDNLFDEMSRALR